MISQTLHIVRHSDPDRFLISLMMPRRHRVALWSIFAFDIEIAKTKYVVTDATIGRIRLQWWRDAIEEIYTGQNIRRHEVIEPLAQAIKAYELPQALFENAIQSREAEFMPDDIKSKQCFENYCLLTSLPIDQLALQILGSEAEEEGQQISQNFGLIRTVLTLPKQLGHGLLLLPEDILSKHDLSCQRILDYRRYDDLRPLVKEVLNTAIISNLQKPSTKYYQAMNKIILLYQNHIEKNNYDLFNPSIQKPIPYKSLKTWLSTV